jgi:hypothetical protein
LATMAIARSLSITSPLAEQSSHCAGATASGVQRQRPVGRAGNRVIGHETRSAVGTSISGVMPTALHRAGCRGVSAVRSDRRGASAPTRRAPGEYGVSWLARREPCLRTGAGICRPRRSRGSVCPGVAASRAPADVIRVGVRRPGDSAAR